jgi:AcrR family transcriptional regulator
VDQAARRAQLLDAAVAAVRDHGPDVSMEQVAAEADLTRPILYQHFGDRAGLAQAIIQRFVDGVAEGVVDAFAAGADRGAVKALIDTFVDLVAGDPDIYRFVVRESSKAAATGAERAEEMVPRLLGFEELSTSISEVLAEQLRAAGQDPSVAEAIAFADMGLVLAGCEWWLSRRSMDRDALVELLTRIVWAGLVELGIREAGGGAHRAT